MEDEGFSLGRSLAVAARSLVRGVPGVPALHFLYAAWRVQQRRRLAWKRARICLVSFPKSGRTWLNVMLANLVTDMAGGGFTLDVPGVLFTHDDSDKPEIPLAVEARKYSEKKVIFLARDPRDILASYYAHRTRRDRTYTGTISEFIRHPGYGVDRVIRFMNDWWVQQGSPKAFLLLRYEDFHADPGRELQRAAEFVGMAPPRALVDRAVTLGAFERMRELERRGVIRDPRVLPAEPDDPDSYKVRKGQIGGYRAAFCRDDIRYLNERLARNLLSDLGYRFEGEENL